MDRRRSFVYKITNLVNGKAYIGVTNRPLIERFYEHCRSGGSKGVARLLTKAIRKYGKDNFSKEIIFTTFDRKFALNVMETFYIMWHGTYFAWKRGYNMSFGGEGNLGAFVSEEAKDKMRATKAANPYVFTDEHRAKLREKRKGRVPTPESIQKQSESARRRYQTMPHHGARCWLVRNPSGEEIVVLSLAKLCLELGCAGGNILKATLRTGHPVLRGPAKGWMLLDKIGFPVSIPKDPNVKIKAERAARGPLRKKAELTEVERREKIRLASKNYWDRLTKEQRSTVSKKKNDAQRIKRLLLKSQPAVSSHN